MYKFVCVKYYNDSFDTFIVGKEYIFDDFDFLFFNEKIIEDGYLMPYKVYIRDKKIDEILNS
jgi:hypothetical protein